MLYILIVLAIVIVESLLKSHIDKTRELDVKEEILKGKFVIRKHYNKGAFLNFLDEREGLVKIISGVLLGVVTLAFAIILPKKDKSLYKLGLAFILGGGYSNVGDRILKGKVVDYISVNKGRLKRIIFNLADIAIFIGSIILIIASFVHPSSNKQP